MRRLLIVLPLIFIITACSTGAAPIQKEFSSAVESNYNGVKIKADVVSKNHILKIRMKKPESLRGFLYRYKGSKLTVSRGGLKLEADENYLPDNAFSSIINNVLKAVNHDEINYSGTIGNKAEYKGKCERGDFIITSDYNTGYIMNIKLKKLGFSADFTPR